MKAAIGWARQDLRAAAAIVSGKPKWAWYLPWNVFAYHCLVGVMRESWQFLRGMGMVENPVVDHLAGARYYFDQAGNLVRRERAGTGARWSTGGGRAMPGEDP